MQLVDIAVLFARRKDRSDDRTDGIIGNFWLPNAGADVGVRAIVFSVERCPPVWATVITGDAVSVYDSDGKLIGWVGQKTYDGFIALARPPGYAYGTLLLRAEHPLGGLRVFDPFDHPPARVRENFIGLDSDAGARKIIAHVDRLEKLEDNLEVGWF